MRPLEGSLEARVGLGLVPLVNVVMFFVFAFSEWPVVKELKATRRAYDLYRQNRNRQQVGPY